MRVGDIASDVASVDRLVGSATRPFVLINERELSVLRRGLTKDGWKRALYTQKSGSHHGMHVGAGLLSVADRWVQSDIEIPERGGHYHRFFCDCGTRLEIPEDLDVAPEYTCPACHKTCSGEDYDGAVRYIKHNHLAGAALSLALVYAIEKEKRYADKAIEILVKYAENYPGPHTDHLNGGIHFQSLCEAVWAIPMAQAYDIVYYSRSLTDAQRDLIEKRLFRCVAEGLMKCGIDGNWGSWHLSAVGVIGWAIRDASLVRYALEGFESQIANQLGSDGLWPESVHTYHFYPLSAFVHFAEACCRAGLDIYQWTVRPGKSLQRMFLAPLRYMYPSFRLPAINDGWYDSFLPLDLYEIAHRRWEDPVFSWVLKTGYRYGESPVNAAQEYYQDKFTRSGFYAFLFGRDLPGRCAGPRFESSDFPNLGICVLRNPDDVVATFDYGPFLGHGHRDKLGFTLYANDSVLVPDFGTPGYGSKILGWYQDTACHNTVVVDGKSQEPSTEHGLVHKYAGSFVQCAEAEASDCYPGVEHNRRLLLIGRILFVSDVLSSGDEHNYDWLVRCPGRPELIGDYERSANEVSDYGCAQFGDVWNINDGFRVDWQCETSRLGFCVWAEPNEAVVALGECPGETAVKRASFLVCRKRARDARFLSILLPSKSEGKITLERSGCVLKASDDHSTDYVCLRDCAGGWSDYGLETDGQMAAVRIQNGQISAIALGGGTRVVWHGETLLECPALVDCVEVTLGKRGPDITYCGDTAGTVTVRTNARAIRVNGHGVAAARTSTGQAVVRIMPPMLIPKSVKAES